MQVRAARRSDVATCGGLDASYRSDLTYQLAEERPSRTGAMEVSVSFRPVQLPRPRAVVAVDATDELEAAWEDLDLFLVAEDDERVIGFITARRERDLAWVEHLVVHAPYRRRRVASSLLRAVREWASQAGLRTLLAAAPTRNHPAVALLRTSGFVFCGYNERHYSSGEIALYLAQDVNA